MASLWSEFIRPLRPSTHRKQLVQPSLRQQSLDPVSYTHLDVYKRQPYYRSSSVWFAKAGVEPGAASVRVAAVAGSAQFRYAQARGWKVAAAQDHFELTALLAEGKADAALIPMATALTLRQQRSLQSLNLMTTLMPYPGLSGDVCFGIDPQNPELRDEINKAFDRIKRDGRFDRLNSEHLPFRLQ